MNPLRRIWAYATQSREKWDVDLIHAVAADQLDQVRTLISNGADVNAKDDLGITVLAYAAHGGRVEIVQYLLDHGANPIIETRMRAQPWVWLKNGLIWSTTTRQLSRF